MFILENPSMESNPVVNSTDLSDSDLQSTDDKKFLSFYVMPKYGNNLE